MQYPLKNKLFVLSIIGLSFFTSCAQDNQAEIRKIKDQIAAEEKLLYKQTERLKQISNSREYREERNIFELDSARIQQNIFELQQKLDSLTH